MYITDFYVAIVLGLVLSLLVSELLGISPGGIITPAYLALVCDSLSTVLVILLIALATFAIVRFGLSKLVILYGRRQFVAMILVAVVLKLLLELAYPLLPFAVLEFSGIGVLVPALIANSFTKQGIGLTTVSLAGVTGAVFACMNAVYLLV